MEYEAVIKKIGGSLFVRLPMHLAIADHLEEGETVRVIIKKRRRADSRTE